MKTGPGGWQSSGPFSQGEPIPGSSACSSGHLCPQWLLRLPMRAQGGGLSAEDLRVEGEAKGVVLGGRPLQPSGGSQPLEVLPGPSSLCSPHDRPMNPRC